MHAMDNYFRQIPQEKLHKVIAYTDTSKTWKLGQSLHLAIYEQGSIVPLNFGYGVLFAPANYDNTSSFKSGATRTLIHPWLFRMADGKIGVVAESREGMLQGEQETSISASPGSLLFWTTLDLVEYFFEGLITIAEGMILSRPQVTYENGLYVLTWVSTDGDIMESTTTDFKQFTPGSVSVRNRQSNDMKINEDYVSCVLSISEQEECYLRRKLGEVENIGVHPLPEMSVTAGTRLRMDELPGLTALYSDSSTADKIVHWDRVAFEGVDFDKPGTYRITGKAAIKDYAWPLIEKRADPDIVRYEERYYFIATDEALQEHLYIRVADTLEGLADAPDHLLLDRSETGDLSGLFWAPELQLIGGKLHILFAGSTESGKPDWWKHVQCRVMSLEGADPCRAADWSLPQRVTKSDGITPLYDSTGITLDMTYFEVNGTHYYVWSQREIEGGIDSADLMIASMDPVYPARLAGDPVLLAKPRYGWDRQGEVNEGPYMLRRGNDVFLTFSGSSTDNTYAVGLLSAKANSDLLDPESWKLTGYPVLASDHVEGQLGPGHNGFTKDEDGNDVLVFHARPDGGIRSAGLRRVHWAFDGTPVLYMTPERELKLEFRNPVLTIHVKENAGSPELVQETGEITEDYASLLTYTKGTGADDNHVSGQRESALYAAVRMRGASEYDLLNNGRPILFPTSSYAAEPVGSGKMASPSLFRKPDGTFGLIAANGNDDSRVYLFDTDDLTAFTNERLLILNDNGIAVQDPFAEYDENIKAYRVRWTGGDGQHYETITDLEATRCFKPIASLDRQMVPISIPEAAGAVSVIMLTKAEYDRVVQAFSRIINTGVNYPFVTVAIGQSVMLPESVEVLYSDGSSKRMGVLWEAADAAKVDIHTAGEYTVKGTIRQHVYADPFIKYRADPFITRNGDGYYYFTASYPIKGDQDPEGYDRIVLRRSRTLEGLGGTVDLYGNTEEGVEEIVIWDEQNAASNHRFIWAPEIHQIKGKWYVLFTASRKKSDVWAISPAVIGCGGDGDPFKPENWGTEATFCEPVPEDKIAFSNFSLDMTYFEAGGKHYVIWAQYVGHSCLLIASINPECPWKLTSPSVILSSPQYAWEKATDGVGMIDEGPAVIKKDGKIYVAFSASSVNWSYCIGLMTAIEGTDLLNPLNWTKNTYPALTTDDLLDQQGPGHNSFTTDEFGNPVIIYHARTPGEKEGSGNGGLGDPGRHARVKPVHFALDGRIVLSMKPEEELSSQYRVVTLQVIVANKNGDFNETT
ncbi:hypothetical protein PAECIP111892_03091 [Paenibacillus auburnensis]|uniref:Bacterial Ig-like domain-containing protein n=1 Tax=Paenibacillus auburnensis TaxID=2905649 RepID=A0ABN8GJ61_9BACL|nr:family 43 glycosylhydrolase [Paenibacillus auburnensis]CAH1208331.1 hypothetical protein PAECIP111892_03091 [Paenibacillus auburnensis]